MKDTYNRGEKVIYETHPNKPEGKILDLKSIDPQYGKIYNVEWDDKNLIPPISPVPSKYLRPAPNHGHPYPWPDCDANINHNVDRETHCPKCGKEWKVTYGMYSNFHDCLDCGLKREDVWNEE